jgi:hypothetical protein
MQRYVFSLVIGIAIWATVGVLHAQQCPLTDVRAAVDQACPCASARNHGQHMKCVRARINKLRASGCSVSAVMRCAEMSTCGRPQNRVVCCTRMGRAQVLSATQCERRGGTVIGNAVSICDATCQTPPPQP